MTYSTHEAERAFVTWNRSAKRVSRSLVYISSSGHALSENQRLTDLLPKALLLFLSELLIPQVSEGNCTYLMSYEFSLHPIRCDIASGETNVDAA